MPKLTRIAHAILILAVAFTLTGGKGMKSGKGGNGKKGNYLGGSGAAVKSWSAKDFEQVKTYLKPVCIYIYDWAPKHNAEAETIENALESGDIAAKLKNFTCVKLKYDGSDSKGWSADMLAGAKGGAVLVLMSSDMKTSVVIDRNTGHTEVPGKIESTLESIAKYEETLKKDKAVAKVGAPPPAAADKKADEKKAGEKKPDDKAVAAKDSGKKKVEDE